MLPFKEDQGDPKVGFTQVVIPYVDILLVQTKVHLGFLVEIEAVAPFGHDVYLVGVFGVLDFDELPLDPCLVRVTDIAYTNFLELVLGLLDSKLDDPSLGGERELLEVWFD